MNFLSFVSDVGFPIAGAIAAASAGAAAIVAERKRLHGRCLFAVDVQWLFRKQLINEPDMSVSLQWRTH